MGLTDKYLDCQIKVASKMMPTLMGSAFKFIKMLSPGRAFKMFVDGLLKDSQVTEPLSNLELIRLSDRGVIIKTTNSVILKKYGDMLKKSVLTLDLKEYWELGNTAGKEMFKNFGFDLEGHVEEDSITTTIKLLK